MLTENKTTELKREYVDDIKNTVIALRIAAAEHCILVWMMMEPCAA